MKKFLLPVSLLCAVLSASAQKVSKKPLDYSVFDGWQAVTGDRISNDGKWIMYVIKPQAADAELVITDAGNKNKLHVERADTARFTADSKYAVALIKPFYAATRMARIKKKKPSEYPKDTLAIIKTGVAGMEKIANVRSFKIADKASVLAYFIPADSNAVTTKRQGADTGRKAAPTVTPAELTLVQLLTGKTKSFKNVGEYQLNKTGTMLAFTVAAGRRAKDLTPGVFLANSSAMSL